MELLLTAAAAAAAFGLVGYLVVLRRDAVLWDRQASRQLDLLSPELVGQLDETAVLRVALADSLELLRCQAVVVVLYPRRGVAGRVASLTSVDDEQVTVRVLPADQEVPAPPDGSVVVPLHGSSQPLGEIRVIGGSRPGRQVRARVIRGFAHMLASSLCAERMFDEQRRVIEDTYQRTLRDDLTGLGNRALLQERGKRQLIQSEAQGRHAAMFLMDIDDFKQINDTLGHEAGDRVLIEVARRLRGVLRDPDVAVRLGGDEFAVLALELNSSDEAEQVAERLAGSFVAPFVIDDVQLKVYASMGVAVHGEDGETVQELMRAADEAMYVAKAEGSGLWRRRAAAAPHGAVNLAEQLRTGLPDDQLLVHYQPQVDASSLRVIGFEALLRWSHPSLGLLRPDDFLPTAERSGLMNQLTLKVLDRTLEDLRQLRLSAPGATVSVNISGRNLLSHRLVSDVATALERHGVTPSSLILEITEPAPGPAIAVAAAVVGLQELGCQVSIHDFGAGSSSVTALSHYHAIREIKIYPNLAGRVLDDPSAERLIQAMVQTAHALNIRVVAEGVESSEVATRLRQLGCDRLQGYHFHEPSSVAALTSWLADRQGSEGRGAAPSAAAAAATNEPAPVDVGP